MNVAWSSAQEVCGKWRSNKKLPKLAVIKTNFYLSILSIDNNFIKLLACEETEYAAKKMYVGKKIRSVSGS